MTRARALKQVIRARAARTGERYTTARRHVLNNLQPHTARLVRVPSTPASDAATDTPADAAPAASGKAKSAALSTSSKGGVSDAKSREKTGHGLEHWFDVLDRFGGVEKGHTASARHLYEAHKVDGWYAQGITVAYERERGVRALNQRCDGEYEVSVSKVVSAKTADVIEALTESRQHKRWAKAVDAGLVKALSTALDSSASQGFVVRPDGQGRYRYKWGNTTVQMYLYPKAGGKVSLVAINSKLSDAAMVEERRDQWRTALKGLAELYSASKKRSG
jgi:hypothetical protein